MKQWVNKGLILERAGKTIKIVEVEKDCCTRPEKNVKYRILRNRWALAQGDTILPKLLSHKRKNTLKLNLKK